MADKKWSEFPVAETPVSGSDVVVGLQLRSTESDQQNVQYTMDDIATYVLGQDSNTGGGGGNAFGTIAVSGQSDVVADSASDTLTLVAGSNITLTTSAGGDSVTIAASGGSGGGLVLLEQHTASGSASLDFTTCITSTYDEYIFEIVGLVPATDNVSLLLRCSTNGGSSYDTGSNYAGHTRIDSAAFSGVGGADSGATSIANYNNIDTTTTQASVNASYKCFNPLSSSLYKMFTTQGTLKNNDGRYYSIIGNGVYLSATAVNALRFEMSSGNIASGTIRAYGVAK